MRTVALAEIAAITAGQSPPGSTYNEEGLGLPFFQGKADFGEVHPTARKWCTAPKKIAEAGDILISVRAPVGPTNIAAERCCIGRGLAAIRPDGKATLPDFIHWVLKHREPQLAAKATGSTFTAIGQTDLRSLLVPVPPLNEQRRIVDILNRAARIQALRRRAAERVREFVPALFVKMFGDGHQIVVRFPNMALREAATIASGATKGRSLDSADAVEVPYLRVANVQDGFLALDEIKTITIRRGEQQRYALASGDLVMTEGGDLDKLGRAAIWNGELDYCAHQNHVFRVRPRAGVVLTDYLRDLAGSAYGKAYFLSIAKRTTGIASINKTQLGGFPVPVPPLDLQHRYAEIVEAARALVRVAESSTRIAATLTTSLMSEMCRSDGLERRTLA